MPLSARARHYLESVWGERIRELAARAESERQALRRGLTHPSDIYVRVGFLNYLQPDLDHIARLSKARAESLTKAYLLDGRSLTPEIIEEVLKDVEMHAEQAAMELMTRKQNELRTASASPAFQGVTGADMSDLGLRILATRRETRDKLERQLTIEMYEGENTDRDAVSAISRGGRTAAVISVLIASPSDVRAERDIVERAIHLWNSVHFRESGVLLFPVRWETHCYPASGERTQAIVNRQIVDESDVLIGIFGVRLGTATGEAESGTLEEIERFRKAGKHVALYFSAAPIPRDVKRDELEALEVYRREREKDSLLGTFSTAEELRQLITQHLPFVVSEVSKRWQPPSALAVISSARPPIKADSESDKAVSISLSIQNLYQTRSSTHYYWNADIFVLASVELSAPQSTDVKYALEVVLSGKTVSAELCDDVARYCRAMKKNSYSVDVAAFTIDPLATSLTRGRKREGWLHFLVKGIPESVLRECKFRLLALASNGVAYCEIEPPVWLGFGSDYYIIPVPDESPASTDIATNSVR